MKNITEPLQDASSTAHQNAALSANDAAIEVMNLVKRYPKAKSKAVDGISFMVRRGEIFGLLGPNGAGKTTTISILTTGAMPTGGTVRIMGIDAVPNSYGASQTPPPFPQRATFNKRFRGRDLRFSPPAS